MEYQIYYFGAGFIIGVGYIYTLAFVLVTIKKMKSKK